MPSLSVAFVTGGQTADMAGRTASMADQTAMLQPVGPLVTKGGLILGLSQQLQNSCNDIMDTYLSNCKDVKGIQGMN